jgi:hypothetical protein
MGDIGVALDQHIRVRLITHFGNHTILILFR